MQSILECSRRTITKIVLRMNLACFECGWNDCVCDIHHILEQSNGGADDASNLTYLCPNCHRKAHNGLLTKFKTLEEVIGDRWKQFYNVTPRTGKSREFGGKIEFTETMKNALEKARQTRTDKASRKASEVLERFKLAQIDVSVYGWIEKASKVLNVAPQRVVWYLKKHDPSLLNGAKMRKSR